VTCTVADLEAEHRVQPVCLDDARDCEAVELGFDRSALSPVTVSCTVVREHADLDALVARAQAIADGRERQLAELAKPAPLPPPPPPAPSPKPAASTSEQFTWPATPDGWYCYGYVDPDWGMDSACFSALQPEDCELTRKGDPRTKDGLCVPQNKAACVAMTWRLKNSTLRCFTEFGHCKRMRSWYLKNKRDDLLSITECQAWERPK
jgi:hypothetical protein